MDYIFGTIRKNGEITESLKTVGAEHTDLKGRISVRREYYDSIITDTFTIAEHYNSAEDESGKCYDFYTIKSHYRDTDMFTPKQEDIESKIEFIAMMSDIDIFDDDESEVRIDE